MTPEDYAKAREVFSKARRLPEDGRAAYVEGACGGHPEILREVESLLQHLDSPLETEAVRREVGAEAADALHGHEKTDPDRDAPDVPADQPTTSAVDRTETRDTPRHPRSPDAPRFAEVDQTRAPRQPKKIGDYTIKRIIASGGMGTVYEAMQEHPRRVVAIKLMKHGIASRTAMRRFEYESQILARLQHPGIAQVFEAGTHTDAEGTVPFFAMEYIPNAKPITEYVQEGKLGTRQRLELFAQVCEAVHHGHQKGIIHRDLKPGNILVDSHGRPRVIDFGVARGTDSDLAVTTLQTDMGQLIGTLQYMSPEQCDADPHDLDIRSDVYALGVVAYEILCGQLPYDVRHAAVFEATRIIREQAATRLSTVAPALRGDVETIVHKSLEKDRERRYRSAAEMGDDIRRYLNNEPIIARPPTMRYQLRVFVRRNKSLVGTVVAVLVVLLVASVVSTTLYLDADAGWEAASQAQQAEAEQRVLAERERDRARYAEQEALNERTEARRMAYIANISAALAALEDSEGSTLRTRLHAAPSEFRNWEWSYLNAAADQSLASCSEVQGFEIAYSQDGRRLAVAAGRRGILILDALTCAELLSIPACEGQVLSVVFDHQSYRVASGCDDGSIGVWDADTGERLADSPASGREEARMADLVSVTFSPDGTRLACALGDVKVRIRDALTADELLALPDHSDFATSAAFSPDGALVASAAAWHDRPIRVWDARTGAKLASFPGHHQTVNSMAFSADGRFLASASEDATVRVWRVEDRSAVSVLRSGSREFVSVAFSPDDTSLAATSRDMNIHIWDVGTGAIRRVLRGHVYTAVPCLAYSPDGLRLATVSSNDGIRFWDAAADESTLQYRGHTEGIRSVAFSPGGSRLASTSDDRTVRVWDMDTGIQLATLRGHAGSVTSVAYSDNGSLLATGSEDGTVGLWDALTGELLAFLRGHAQGVFDVAFQPGTMHVASASDDGSIRIWDATTFEAIQSLEGHSDHVKALAFDPDGLVLASGASDSTVRLWNAKSGDPMRVLAANDLDVVTVAFSKDGKLLASAGWAGDIRIWRMQSGEHIATLSGHEYGVTCVAFSPDSTRLASGSTDSSLRLWDVSTGEEMLRTRLHTDGVTTLAFSPDGTRIVTGSEDQTVRIWDTLPYRERFRARTELGEAQVSARVMVDAFLEELGEPRLVAQRLREDRSLGERQRQAALNILLREAAQLQEHLAEFVGALFSRHVFTEDVVRAIEADESLSPSAKRSAIMRARAHGDAPRRLNNDSWNLVRFAGRTAEEYRLGLRGAEAVVVEQPDEYGSLNTLGVAQYRCGLYDRAVETLSRCDSMRRENAESSVPHDLAFLAMALYKVHRPEEAQAVYERVQQLMSEVEWKNNEEVATFLEECELLLAPAESPPGKSPHQGGG